MNKKIVWVFVGLFLFVVICLLLNDKFGTLFLKAGPFEAGVKTKELKNDNAEHINFEANNNSYSTITQVAGDIVINKTGEYSWINKNSWKEDSGETGRYKLKFYSSEDILPPYICIHVKSDADISYIGVEGIIESPISAPIPLGKKDSNLSFAFECHKDPKKEIFVILETKNESKYIDAIATTSGINLQQVEPYIIRRQR